MNPQNQHLLHMSTIFKFLKISIFHAIKIDFFLLDYSTKSFLKFHVI